MTDPRIERTRAAVLDASGELVAEHGVAGFTVDAVAKRSGVARTTIYRHWPDPNQLLFDTFACMKGEVPLPDTGSLRDDLVAHFGELAARMEDTWGRVLAAMLDATFRVPELRPLHQEFTDQRRQPARDLVARAIDRGDLPADLDVERLLDRLAGPIFYRFLVLQQPMARADVETLVDDVLAARLPVA